MIASGSFSTYNFDGDNLVQRLKLYNTNTPEFRKATFVKNSSKGNVGKNKGYGAPEYIGRDPRLTVSVSKIAQNSVTVQFATRANVQRVHERRSYVSTVDEMLNRAARKCTAVVNKIIAECNKEKKKFFDKSFHFGDRMTMYPPGSPNDCTVSEPRRIARLSDLYPDSSLFGNNARGDYFQGAIGDCFYIGAVAAMWGSSIPDSTKPIERLFPAHSQDFGVYGVLFFKNGGWEWVVVDDFIAVQDDGVTPLYSNVNCKILWPLILEKAYAKVHFCWDSIDGGWLREALADITGGIEYTIDLAGVHRKMTFAEFSSWVDDPYTVLGCAVGQHVREVGGSGRAGELQTVHGLFKGHAYSVLKAIQTSDGEQFIRVRNPWGNEAEWTGAYSDRAIDWKRNQLHFRELCPEFKDDGAFWMKWQDFKQFFSDVDVCRFFSQNLKCIMTYGISVRTPIVPNNLFILGIKTSRPTAKIVLSLGQDDPKAQSNHREAKTLPYAIIRLSIKALKTVPKSFTELQGSLSRSIDTNKVYNRQVHEYLDLPNGFYSLVPQFFDAPPGIGFYLGCFCDAEDEVFLYRFDSKESTFLTTEKNGVVSQEIPANVPQPVMDVIAPPAPSSNDAGSLTVGQSNVTLFSMAGGIEKAVEEAFRYADVSGRGFIEATTATHTFSRLLMQSDIGRHFRQFLQNMGTGSINRSAFNDLVADILEKNLGSKAAVNALFSIEGGFSLCCRNAFNRTDSWNAGRLYRLHSELALSRLLMMSDIGCEFRNLLQRTGTYQLTLMQMQKLCHQAICQHDFN